MFSNHNRIKLETNNKKIYGKSLNTYKLNNTFLNNPGVNEEIYKGN